MINHVKHLAYLLKIPLKELEEIGQRPDNYYYEDKEVKLNKDGSPKLTKEGKPDFRILYPSLGRLKVIQKRINKDILRHYNCLKLPDFTYGAVKRRDNVQNARKHQGKKFNFTTDLKKFFPSISHKAVFQLFVSRGFSPSVSRLLTQLTTYKGQLPQGAPTSSALANLVFAATGQELNSLCQQFGITFTTFIDDLTFSSPSDFQQHHKTFIDCIKRNGFKVSYSKTHYRTKNPVVTGIIVKNNCLDVTNEFKIKLLVASSENNYGRLQGLQLYRKKVIEA